MKIVDFREKTEALETVRKPPFRELSEKLREQLAAFFFFLILVRPRRRTDVARFTSVVSSAGLSVSWTSLCSAPGGAPPVRPQPCNGGRGWTQRWEEVHLLRVLEKKGLERRKLCVLKILPSQLCFVI